MNSMEKWVTRSDAWTPTDDERLSEIVLRHIRTGSTQLKAFEEAGNELGRTPAACGYRWNGVLRKDRRTAVEDAKQARKSAQRSISAKATETSPEAHAITMTSADSMREVIQFLHTYDNQYQSLRTQVQQLENERNELQTRLQELELAQVNLQGEAKFFTPEQLQQDSKTLFDIMERARRLLDPDRSRAE